MAAFDAPCAAASPEPTLSPIHETIFLSTKIGRIKRLACTVRNGTLVVGMVRTSFPTQVLIEPLPASIKKRDMKRAKSECAALVGRPSCSDRIDNDFDGLIDAGADPDCASPSDDSEVHAAGDLSLRRPFDGAFSLSSPFDHSFPLEFIHTDGRVLTTYGDETTIGVDGHQGYDFDLPPGTPVLAAHDGIAEFAGMDPPAFCPLLEETVAGNSVVIRREIGGKVFVSLYAHLETVDVQPGQLITAGQQLGLSGNTGCSTFPHLHFDVLERIDAENNTFASIDPYGWNGAETDPWSVHPQGTTSRWLWKEGSAPQQRRFTTVLPNPGPDDRSPVAIVSAGFAGPRDDLIPNNEYVEFILDRRFVPSGVFDMTGFTLKTLAGATFKFPRNFRIRDGKPVRLYSGSGKNTQTALFWRRQRGVLDNRGDCVRLFGPDGSLFYFHFYGLSSCG